MKIAYYTPDTLSLNKALILSRADKSTGKSKTWIDIEKSRRLVSSEFHFANITGIAQRSDKNIEVLRENSVELENWNLHHVYNEVENKEQMAICVR